MENICNERKTIISHLKNCCPPHSSNTKSTSCICLVIFDYGDLMFAALSVLQLRARTFHGRKPVTRQPALTWDALAYFISWQAAASKRHQFRKRSFVLFASHGLSNTLVLAIKQRIAEPNSLPHIGVVTYYCSILFQWIHRSLDNKRINNITVHLALYFTRRNKIKRCHPFAVGYYIRSLILQSLFMLTLSLLS
jgi:hypothetical protein